jgi:hypothetical protein
VENQYPRIYDLLTNTKHTERLVRSTDEGNFEYAIYDIQNTLFNSLILETVEQGHHYLLQENVSA